MLRTFLGVSSKTQILIKTLLSDNVSKEQQSAAYSKLAALSALGFIIGPIAGGYLYQKYGDFTILSILLSTFSIICIGNLYVYYFFITFYIFNVLQV